MKANAPRNLPWRMEAALQMLKWTSHLRGSPPVCQKNHTAVFLFIYIKSIIDARHLYLAWHKEAKAGEGVAVSYPLVEMDIKTFTVACAKAGFSYKRIVNIFRGLCMCASAHQMT